MMSSWSLIRKLWLLSCFLLFITLAVGLLSFWNTKVLMGQLNDIASNQLPAVRNMTLVDMMHDGLRATAFRSIIISGSKDPKVLEEVSGELKEFKSNMKTYLENISKLEIREETREKVTKVQPAVEEYLVRAEKVVTAGLDGKTEQAIHLLEPLTESFEALEKDLGSLGEDIEKDAHASSERAHLLSAQAQTFGGVLIFAGLITGFLFAWWLVRDLRKRLSEVVGRLGGESGTLNKTASDLAQAAGNLRSSTSTQASALQETAASIEEITAMAQKTNESAKTMEKNVTSNQQSVERGRSAIEQMLTAMEKISEGNTHVMRQIEDSNKKITDIVNVISEIENKTKVINDIVFQTKLLSFNASVEAARAGEQGKGFAVVAQEVGNLAQMSGNAAREISEMLSASVSKVQTIVSESQRKIAQLSQDAKSRIDQGTQTASDCSRSLNEIVEQSEQLNAMTTQISSAIDEQSHGVAEVSKALNLLNTATTKNSTTSEQAAGTSQSLLGHSYQLKTIINDLRQLALGEAGANEQVAFLTTEPTESEGAHSEAA